MVLFVFQHFAKRQNLFFLWLLLGAKGFAKMSSVIYVIGRFKILVLPKMVFLFWFSQIGLVQTYFINVGHRSWWLDQRLSSSLSPCFFDPHLPWNIPFNLEKDQGHTRSCSPRFMDCVTNPLRVVWLCGDGISHGTWVLFVYIPSGQASVQKSWYVKKIMYPH